MNYEIASLALAMTKKESLLSLSLRGIPSLSRKTKQSQKIVPYILAVIIRG